MCASNEFEREEKRDLQEILLQKLQLNLPEILKDEKLKEDLFQLPRDALEILFSNTETCVSEFDLFKSLKDKLESIRSGLPAELFKEKNQSEQSEPVDEPNNDGEVPRLEKELSDLTVRKNQPVYT